MYRIYFSEEYLIINIRLPGDSKTASKVRKKSYILSFFIKFGGANVFADDFMCVLCYRTELTHFCIIIRGLFV